MRRVGDLMDTFIVAVREETTVQEVYALIRRYNMNEFPVVNAAYQFRGMVYAEDILRVIYPMNKRLINAKEVEQSVSIARQVQVKNFMVRDVRVAAPFSNTIQLGAEMLLEKIKIVPVVDKGRLVGLVSQSRIFMAIMGTFLEKKSLEIFAANPPVNEQPVRKGVFVNDYSGAEKRRYERVKVRIPVAYQIANAAGAVEKQKGKLASMLDIGIGGLLLQTDEELTRDTLVELAFDLSGKSEPVKRLGRVIHSSHDAPTHSWHCGVMFFVMNSSEQAEIEQFVRGHLS